ncbi:MAG: Crp/Fnr family transcriptional regulator [Hyphomicrobiales bacterium]|nr:Crp/Fnr family transcriptional regulator [Hyphomicrobiales bacterium]
MTLDSDAAHLARTRPFSLLPREAVQLIAFSCEKRLVEAGEALFRAGEEADAGFFVLSGAVVLTEPDARRDTGRRVTAGALIGENALYAPLTRRHEARADEDALVARVPREVFRRVLSEFPDAAEKVRLALAERTRRLLDGLDATRRRSLSAPPRVRSAP